MKDYYQREIFKDLKKIFVDSSNRPKNTPFHESAIIRKLEEKYNPKEIIYALKKLQNKELPRKIRLSVRERKIRKSKIKFYYPYYHENNPQIRNRIFQKIDKTVLFIQKYSSKSLTKMLGDHLHHLVKSEIRANGFIIIGEKTNIYNNRKWTTKHTSHSLDIIAKHPQKKITIGIEIKNTMAIIPEKELEIKIKMCKYFNIIPVFACRWLHPYESKILANDGFSWVFKNQIYPLGQEKLVEKLTKLNYPVMISAELPPYSIEAFKNWLKDK